MKEKWKKYLLGAGAIVLLLLLFSGRLINTDEGGSKLQTEEIANEELLILGTSNTIQELNTYQVYTDKGLYICDENVDITPYLFESVQVVVKENVITRICNKMSRQVTLENQWITGKVDSGLEIFTDGYYISLPMGEVTENMVPGDTIGDISMTNGQVTKILVKKDEVKGKILSIRTDGIEIEGYGILPTSDNFHYFENVGELTQKGRNSIVVGFDSVSFIAAKGELCAAVMYEPLNVDHIRVLIKTSDFADILHSSISLTVHGGYTISYGNGETDVLDDGQEWGFDSSCGYFSGERFVLIPDNPQNSITINNINRTQGAPSYYGNLEFLKDSGGIIFINDVKLETYLSSVVPSEMPAGYGLEALKAQAVCARSYAYRQIYQNGYAQYGAHVDDSVGYQVYNNISRDERTTRAVEETARQVMKYNGDVITAYYFSTSCGYTTDETIWENGSLSHSFISGKLLNDEGIKLDLTEEEAFREFILNCPYTTYDSTESWYRWKVTVPIEQLSTSVNETEDVGDITDITVTQRGEGGVVKEVIVGGSRGEATIETEHAIRKALNAKDMVITRENGKDTTGGVMLPSGFFVVDEVRDEQGNLTGFTFLGGGFGHGAGMSQNGANHMADAGKSYEDILTFFYTGVTIEPMD